MDTDKNFFKKVVYKVKKDIKNTEMTQTSGIPTGPKRRAEARHSGLRLFYTMVLLHSGKASNADYKPNPGFLQKRDFYDITIEKYKGSGWKNNKTLSTRANSRKEKQRTKKTTSKDIPIR